MGGSMCVYVGGDSRLRYGRASSSASSRWVFLLHAARLHASFTANLPRDGARISNHPPCVDQGGHEVLKAIRAILTENEHPVIVIDDEPAFSDNVASMFDECFSVGKLDGQDCTNATFIVTSNLGFCPNWYE